MIIPLVGGGTINNASPVISVGLLMPTRPDLLTKVEITGEAFFLDFKMKLIHQRSLVTDVVLGNNNHIIIKQEIDERLLKLMNECNQSASFLTIGQAIQLLELLPTLIEHAKKEFVEDAKNDLNGDQL